MHKEQRLANEAGRQPQHLAGAVQLAEELEEGVIVTVLADDATKYSEVIERLLP